MPPSIVPIAAPTVTTTTPVTSEIRAPKIRRDSTSRPSSSVPSRVLCAGRQQPRGQVDRIRRIGRQYLGRNGDANPAAARSRAPSAASAY